MYHLLGDYVRKQIITGCSFNYPPPHDAGKWRERGKLNGSGKRKGTGGGKHVEREETHQRKPLSVNVVSQSTLAYRRKGYIPSCTKDPECNVGKESRNHTASRTAEQYIPAVH